MYLYMHIYIYPCIFVGAIRYYSITKTPFGTLRRLTTIPTAIYLALNINISTISTTIGGYF